MILGKESPVSESGFTSESAFSAADMEIRSGGSMMEEVILQKMLYEIVVKKGASIQALNYSEDF